MNYYWYDSNGRIIQSALRASEQDVLSSAFSAEYSVLATEEKLAKLSMGYVEDGAIVLKPAAPSSNHRWDYSAKEWLDPRSLEQHKAARWAEIKAIREANEFGGFTWDGSEFDSDAISQARIQGAVVLAMQALGAEVPFSIDWTLKNNSVRSLTGTQMVAVGQALATHVGTQHEIARILRVSIEESVSVPEVEAVIWP